MSQKPLGPGQPSFPLIPGKQHLDDQQPQSQKSKQLKLFRVAFPFFRFNLTPLQARQVIFVDLSQVVGPRLRRNVGATGRARAKQQADLRHPTGEPDLVSEDAPRASAPREHPYLLGDSRARRVNEVKHRHLKAQRALLDPDYLLNRLRAPGTRLHRRVVSHQRHAAAIDCCEARQDTVSAKAILLPVSEQSLLDEGVRVD